MEESSSPLGSLHAYIQAGAAERASLFSDFVAALRKLQKTGRHDDVRVWANRAVDRSLDYCSLQELRRFVLPQNPLSFSKSGRSPLRIAVLGGPTTIQLTQLLELFLSADGVDALLYESGYGLYRQEILTPGSGLDVFKPDLIFIATSCRDVRRFPAPGSSLAQVTALANAELEDWAELWGICQSKWHTTVIQNIFEIPVVGVLGHLSLRTAWSRESYLDRLNNAFAVVAPQHVVLHDLRGIAAQCGAQAWFDSRFYLEFKMPCGPDSLVSYAHSVMSLVRAIRGKSKKVVVLDLDNTLWGGVVGDVGPGGIAYGQGSGEGEAFAEFQGYLKALRERGILLAVCSKNDEANAREPFERRHDMALCLSDFSCFMANWSPKPDNLTRIAAQLDVKLDALVFIDDNPAERALVRRELPDVATPDLPSDAAGYAEAIAAQRYFEAVSFTREDLSRAQYYLDNKRRDEAATRSTDMCSFLKSLRMKMMVQPIGDLNLERANQLVNKSNQFNLTTTRHSLPEMRAIAESPDWRTLTFSLADSFGDNGLIAVIQAKIHNESLVVTDWVMSCRVLQRGVEHFCRNELVSIARSAGLKQIKATYVPSAKNGMVKDLLRNLGFASAGAEGETTLWTLILDDRVEPLVHFIDREA